MMEGSSRARAVQRTLFSAAAPVKLPSEKGFSAPFSDENFPPTDDSVAVGDVGVRLSLAVALGSGALLHRARELRGRSGSRKNVCASRVSGLAATRWRRSRELAAHLAFWDTSDHERRNTLQ